LRARADESSKAQLVWSFPASQDEALLALAASSSEASQWDVAPSRGAAAWLSQALRDESSKAQLVWSLPASQDEALWAFRDEALPALAASLSEASQWDVAPFRGAAAWLSQALQVEALRAFRDEALPALAA
jgi:hypothetical protein